MHFSFLPITIDLDILSMSAISYMVECWLFSVSVLIWLLLMSPGLPHCGAPSSKKSPAPNFTNHFSHVQSVTAPSPYTAQIFFLHFSCIFTFLEIIKHNMRKIYIFPSSILKWLHKNLPIWYFFNAHDMTAVTIQPTKIALNEIKWDN